MSRAVGNLLTGASVSGMRWSRLQLGAATGIWLAAATAADVIPPSHLDPGRVAADLAETIEEIWGRL